MISIFYFYAFLHPGLPGSGEIMSSYETLLKIANHYSSCMDSWTLSDKKTRIGSHGNCFDFFTKSKHNRTIS